MSLPIVLPNDCASILGDSICAILAQIDASFRDLSTFSNAIELGVNALLEERNVIRQERQELQEQLRALQEEKNTLTQRMTAWQSGDTQALTAAKEQLAAANTDFQRVTNELAAANADLAKNAQDIRKLRTQLEQMGTTAQNTFKVIQDNLSTTNNLLSSKKRKIEEATRAQQSIPFASQPLASVQAEASEFLPAAQNEGQSQSEAMDFEATYPVTQQRTQADKDAYDFNKAVSIANYYPIWLDQYNKIKTLSQQGQRTVGDVNQLRDLSIAMNGLLNQLPQSFGVNPELFSAPVQYDARWFPSINIDGIAQMMNNLENIMLNGKTVREAAQELRPAQ